MLGDVRSTANRSEPLSTRTAGASAHGDLNHRATLSAVRSHQQEMTPAIKRRSEEASLFFMVTNGSKQPEAPSGQEEPPGFGISTTSKA